MARLCGAALGFLAFTVTILAGLAARNPFDVTIMRAIWAMVVFFGIGLFAGWVAYRVVDEHAISAHRDMMKDLESIDSSEGMEPAGESEGEPATVVEPGTVEAVEAEPAVRGH